MMNIVFKCKNNIFNLKLNGKYNVIIGKSGSGKSFLCNCISEVESQYNIKDNSCKMHSLNERVVVLFNRVHKHLFVLDEDFVSSDLEFFWEDIKHSDNYYIFITREGYSKIPYGVNTTFTLEQNGNVYTMKEKYDDTVYSNSFSDCKCIVTEDSGIGYNLIKNKLNLFNRGFPVISSRGRTNLHTVVENLEIKCAVVFDNCGIGKEFNNLYYLLIKDMLRLYNSESFECEIIKCLFRKLYIKYSDTFMNTTLSAEDYYIEKLNEILLDKIGIGYNKNSDVLLNLFLNGKIFNDKKLLDLGVNKSELESVYKYLFNTFGNRVIENINIMNLDS